MLLGTKTDQQDKASNDQANTAGEDEYFIPTYAHSTDAFVEGPPTTAEWLRDQVPSPQAVHDYLYSLFPCLSWVGHYNTQWAAGDIVAGITIGAVVVPQSMAYALLANLEPQYGLYSSFIGVMIYWIFGTSKDISIGPVAVLSTVVGNIIDDVRMTRSDLPAHTIASAVSVIAGSVVLALGLLRFGYLIDLISITSLSAFMTGSAITIVVSQLPALLGASGFSNREAPYKVLLNTLAHLPGNNMDAAVGLSTLAMLYLIRHTFSWAAAKYPRRKRLLFFINTMRSVLIIVLYTCISFALNVSHKDNPVIKILGAVPRGFPRVILPDMDHDLASKIGHHLPATVIVMLVEHMAISKSFGRVNNYTIDPSQEMVAIGVTNILSPFFGGYSSTGSFSRTAIQSKAGVRTPAAGITAGVVVLLAMFLLTDVFFFIPTATLAAVIIHAVGDLLTSRDTIRQFWRVAPLEVLIFFVGVIVSIFGHIEDGLYATVCLSACVFLYRILKARGRFLGKVKVHSVLGDHIIGDHHRQVVGKYGTFQPSVDTTRNVFLPLDHGDGSNPEIAIFNPYPGIFIYRFSEGFNYPNANTALDFLTEFILGQTRRSRPEVYERKGDRPWNNPGLSMAAKSQEDASLQALPTLKAIILDFSAVNNVDITSVQRLIDVRNQLDTYVSPDVVDWHIACINNRWTKRALVAGGFGVPTKPRDGIYHRWKSIFSVAEIGGDDSAAALAEENANKELLLVSEEASDEERAGACQPVRSHNRRVESLPGSPRRGATVHSWDKPLFHVDLTSAVQSAIANAEARQELRAASRAQSIE
ncbi:sulfate transporter family-domain-containing protein [Stachybotrys elegans]|uniref:Sulfate transporter family-domain-containing protein n=1 Tax=Stachybotrys elegans TaxID=80388 RepID=A0A8K0T3Y0_9HYPO|nr:sulfate transporter family-domain-containing protein [Stachybotrys elegans]